MYIGNPSITGDQCFIITANPSGIPRFSVTEARAADLLLVIRGFDTSAQTYIQNSTARTVCRSRQADRRDIRTAARQIAVTYASLSVRSFQCPMIQLRFSTIVGECARMAPCTRFESILQDPGTQNSLQKDMSTCVDICMSISSKSEHLRGL